MIQVYDALVILLSLSFLPGAGYAEKQARRSPN